jgi:osmotically-inducible protein OsmY
VGTSLSTRIERALEQEADLHLAVREGSDRITISGIVDSAEAREAAISIASRLAGGKPIDPDIDVEVTLPHEGADGQVPSAGNLADTIVEVDDANVELVPDLMGASPGLTDERLVIEDGEEPYFPPTDPVVAPGRDGGLEVLNGWAETSDGDAPVAPSVTGGRPGDEALADAVRRELREDAATTSLELQVAVRNGAVRLRGRVTDMVDAENAEAVAARVPGVLEVLEELEVQTA